jgi:hypothetical protein
MSQLMERRDLVAPFLYYNSESSPIAALAHITQRAAPVRQREAHPENIF